MNKVSGSEEETRGLTTEDELLTHFSTTYNKDSNPSNLDVMKEDAAALAGFMQRKYRSTVNEVTSVKSPEAVARVCATPFPMIDTIRNYKREYAIFDIPAGLVEGVMAIPMGLAYAPLANMPVAYGLYTGLMPSLVYMLLGTCHQVSMGVAAIECVLLAEGVRGVIGNEVADSEDPDIISIKVQYTLYFTFVVGLWQLAFRLARLQFLSALLSDPVMSGFATGGAIIVGTTQLSGLFGLKLPTEDMLPDLWGRVIKEHADWNKVAIGMGISAIVFLKFFQFINKKYFPKWPVPWQVPLVILAIVVSSQMDLHGKYNLNIVGDIPEGFPKFEFPTAPTVPGVSSLFAKSMGPSFIIALFTYVISLSLAKVFSRKNGYDLSSGRELFAMGTANCISSMMGAFILSASFSRTAVVNAIGAKTVAHNAVAVTVMILALTLITSLLFSLPKCILSAIVLVGVSRVPEFHEGARYYRVNKAEFLIWLTTFVLCITCGAIVGIAGGVGVALFFMTLRQTNAKPVILARLPGTTVYRNAARFPDAVEVPGVKIMRFDASLNFANWEPFVGHVLALATKDVHHVVVDASSINDIDSSSMRGIFNLVEDMEKRGVALLFANWKGPQRDMLERSGFYTQVRRDTMFLALHDAVVYAHHRGRHHGVAEINEKEPATVVEVGGDGHQHEWHVAYPDSTRDGGENKEPETDLKR